MAHARKQIRGAIKTAVTGLATTGTRVYVGRARTLGANHQPALLIYATLEESVAETMTRPVKLRRAVSVVVEGRVVAAAPPDDTLDTIAAEVEAAIGADPTLGGLARNTALVATRVNVDAASDVHAGEIRLEFQVEYRTTEAAPQTLV